MKKDRPVKGNSALIYTRVSDPSQVENTSLSTQERVCREHCEQMGYKLLRIFPEDTGRSGRNGERPSFQSAIQFARESEDVGHFIVFKFNRFYRNAKRHLWDYDELVDKYGVRVESATQECNSDSSLHKKMRGDLAVDAEYESDDIGDKARIGMRAARENGRLTSQPPMGLMRKYNTHGHSSIIHDPDYSSWIRRMFEMCDEGLSLPEIVRILNVEGFRTPGGNALSRRQLGRILRNIKYAGYVPVENGVPPVVGDFDPIISMDLFTRVQEKLDGRRRKPASKHVSDRMEFPLRRFAQCARCGTPLTGSFSTGKSGQKYPYYRCRKCKGTDVPADDLNNMLRGFLARLRIGPELEAFLRSVFDECWSEEIKREEEQRGRIQKEIQNEHRKKEGVLDLVLRGKLGEEYLEEALHRIKARLARLKEEQPTTQNPNWLRRQRDKCLQLLLSDLAVLWEKGSVKVRLSLQDAVFPGKVEWDSTALALDIETHSEGLIMQ